MCPCTSVAVRVCDLCLLCPAPSVMRRSNFFRSPPGLRPVAAPREHPEQRPRRYDSSRKTPQVCVGTTTHYLKATTTKFVETTAAFRETIVEYNLYVNITKPAAPKALATSAAKLQYDCNDSILCHDRNDHYDCYDRNYNWHRLTVQQDLS